MCWIKKENEKLFQNHSIVRGLDVDISLLSKKFRVRKLEIKDVDVVYDMSCKNEIFYKYHPPFVTKESIIEDMEALPPSKSYDDKYYIGFFEKDSLVAILDLILDYPTEETAFIGLFMTNVRYQKKGIGSKIVADICDYLKQLGYKEVRIGVDKGNPQSNAFWLKNGFRIVSENEYRIMELVL